jgi:RecB family exonuclease
MTKHARISASRLERITLCPGSLALEAVQPEEEQSIAAAKGSAIHLLAEHKLKGLQIDELQYDQDMIDMAEAYVAYITSYEANTHIEVDLTDELAYLHSDLGGTADAILVKNNTIIVVDLKTGKVPVSAKNNPQLQMYALGALLKFGDQTITNVEMVIFQPNVAISTASATANEILALKSKIVGAAEEANSPFAKLSPGYKQCKWCRAKGVCPELKNIANDLAASEFNVINKSDSDLLNLADLMVDWGEKVKSMAKDMLKNGGLIEGWELKPGRKMVKFANQIGTEAYLAGNPIAFTVKSPAQLKKLGVQLPEDHLVEVISEPSLARIEKDL